MFSKLSIVVASTLVILVAAGGPLPVSNGGINNSCNTGPVQCCNTVKNSDTETVNWIHLNYGVVAPVTGMVGFECSPTSVIGAGSGANCATQPVCCTGNHSDGLSVGCNPVNIAA